MENISERIQDYIEGILTGEELAQFESLLATDADLRNLVALQREVHNIINKREERKGEEHALRDTLAKAEARIRAGKRSQHRIKKLIPIIAAACAVITFGLFFFNKGDEDLYIVPAMRSEIVRGQLESTGYEAAVKAYNNQSYGVARGLLDQLIAADSSILQYSYYRGLTFVGEENWNEALADLRPVAEGSSVFADEAKYYVAVSYIKLNQKDKAERLLKDIPLSGKLGQKAQKLLKDID